MKRKTLGIAVAVALGALSASAFAVSPYGNGTQKGSLLIFPRVTDNTIIQIANDYSDTVSVKCYYQSNEGLTGVFPASSGASGGYTKKHKTDFQFDITKNQPVWWWSQGGGGGLPVPNLSPMADGFNTRLADLKCWAVNARGDQEIHHNHLIGMATVLQDGQAYTYNAYHFQAVFPSQGTENTGKPLKAPFGQLDLDGQEYDSCSRMALGQFNAVTTSFSGTDYSGQATLVQCTQDLREVYTPPVTKYVFEIYSENEIKFTGTEVCGDSLVEIDLWTLPHAKRTNLKTDKAYFRAQAVGALCPGNPKDNGLMGVLAQRWANGALTGSTMNGRGSFAGGKILWDATNVAPPDEVKQ